MPSAPPPVRPDAPPGMPRATFALLAAFAAFAFTIIVPTALRDGDTGWHLATGAWIVAHGRVPTTDPFSFTAAGRLWVAHEWLSELAMYASYRVAGWSGLIGTAMATLFALVAYEIRRWLSPRASIVALLMLVWANAHGSFVFGLALVGVFALEALIAAAPSDRRRVVLGWGAFGVACAVAATVTPAGIDGLVFPFYVDRLKLLAHLNEWQPADFATFSGFEAILLATLAVLLLRPVRIPPIRLLLMLGVLHLALQHTRQEIVLVVVGILVLAEPLGKAWTAKTAPSATPQRASRSIGVVILLLAIGLAGYRVALPVVRADSAGVPIKALRHVPPPLRRQRVFNEYSFGGSLILAGIRPYIDGRSDMYGDPFTLDYFAIAGGDTTRWRAANARWHFGWTILPPRSPLVRMLDRDPAWQRIYADNVAVIHRVKSAR